MKFVELVDAGLDSKNLSVLFNSPELAKTLEELTEIYKFITCKRIYTHKIVVGLILNSKICIMKQKAINPIHSHSAIIPYFRKGMQRNIKPDINLVGSHPRNKPHSNHPNDNIGNHRKVSLVEMLILVKRSSCQYQITEANVNHLCLSYHLTHICTCVYVVVTKPCWRTAQR